MTSRPRALRPALRRASVRGWGLLACLAAVSPISASHLAAQVPLSGIVIVGEPDADDETWYAGGIRTFMLHGAGRGVLLRNDDAVNRFVDRRGYMAVRFFAPYGYPIWIDDVGLRAIRVVVGGEEAHTFDEAAIERHVVFYRRGVLLPLSEIAALRGASRGTPVEFRLETTSPIEGAEPLDGTSGAWVTTYRAEVGGLPIRRLRLWVPLAVVAWRPDGHEQAAAVFPGGLVLSLRILSTGGFYLDVGAAGYAGIVRTTDDQIYPGFTNAGGLVDFGGWLYAGATWVGDIRAGREHPGVMATLAAGHRLASWFANLAGI